MKPERTKSVPAFMFSKNKHIKGEHMEFYQLKITRKGTKPPVWRRCLVPADTDFAKLAAMLEDILEYADTENYEFEFFQKKLRLQNLEAQTAEATKGSYEYAEAKGRQIAELLDTEAWFTFRVKGMELPEYRTDIEKKITDEEKAGTPEILKETRSAEDDFWTADMQTKNTELEKKYGALGIADIVAKKVAEMEKKMEPEQQENSFSRNPKVRDYLNSYNKEDLIASAIELDIEIDGLSKEELAENITEKVLNPEIMKEIFLQADEWEIEAFDRATERKCFPATHKDWKELEWFSNKGYIVAYSDNHAEVPQEVISVYKQVNTPELQEKCRKLSWMRSCESMMGLIYAIAPLKIVYRMYRKRDGFRVSYEEFMDILNELAEKDGMCIVKAVNILITAILCVMIADGRLSRLEGILLLAGMIFYIVNMILSALKTRSSYPDEKSMPLYKSLIFIAGGLVAVIFGGNLVVNNASQIAVSFGVSQNFIGLTIVAIGTSLPELVTSIVATRKGDSGLALGNAIGSNIFNILFILGMSATISPLHILSESVIDCVILLVSGILLFVFAYTKKSMNRTEGAICVLSYIGYTAYLFIR